MISTLACALARLAAVPLVTVAPAVTAQVIVEQRLEDGTEVPIEIHAATGDALILWLPSGFGRRESEQRLAHALAQDGLEVWRADLLGAHFLAPVESSLEQIPADSVARLVTHAHRRSGKRVYVLASARAGLLALRGVAAMPGVNGLAGVVMLHPNLFEGPPDPGRDARYHAAVAETRVPVFVLQPELSPWRWRLEALAHELQKGGAPVFTRLLPGLRDRYYVRPDATPDEDAAAERLPRIIAEAIGLLSTVRAAQSVARPQSPSATTGRSAPPRERQLQAYRGEPTPPALRLADLQGRARDLRDYRGRVVLVNFWASWCPPCVHEMPSMQRLSERLRQRPFAILAVNMGETPETVREFLASKVNVGFPILMDRDGAALKRWKVFVFPTSFVLGPDGLIHYALFGAHEWDTPETVAIIESLFGSRAAAPR